jgi:uncharacterized protein YndB with AHSA1/START domain
VTHATLTFDRQVAAPVETLWQAWLQPTARAIWSPPAPGVTVDLLETSTEVGGREVSICRAAGYPDVRVEVRWLHLEPGKISVNSETVTSEGATDAVALVTAEFTGDGPTSRIALTVQLAALAAHMQDGYAQGYSAGIGNLAAVAERTMLIRRVILAPTVRVWGAWWNAETLPQWWGPDGFSCRTTRIDLRAGGEWVFDMIGPDGTVWPNHHRYGRVIPGRRLSYSLHWGENGPKHADAWAEFDETDGATIVTLGMVFATAEEFQAARGFGAEALGLQTLGKLAASVGAR